MYNIVILCKVLNSQVHNGSVLYMDNIQHTSYCLLYFTATTLCVHLLLRAYWLHTLWDCGWAKYSSVI